MRDIPVMNRVFSAILLISLLAVTGVAQTENVDDYIKAERQSRLSLPGYFQRDNLVLHGKADEGRQNRGDSTATRITPLVAGSDAAASLVKPYCGSLTTGGDSDEDERSLRPTFP